MLTAQVPQMLTEQALWLPNADGAGAPKVDAVVAPNPVFVAPPPNNPPGALGAGVDPNNPVDGAGAGAPNGVERVAPPKAGAAGAPKPPNPDGAGAGVFDPKPPNPVDGAGAGVPNPNPPVAGVDVVG